MAARVRIDGHDLVVSGHGRARYLIASGVGGTVDYQLLGTVAGIGAASLASLRQAIGAYLRRRERDTWFRQSTDMRRVAIAMTRRADSIPRRPLEATDAAWLSEIYFRDPPVAPVVYRAANQQEDSWTISFSLARQDKPDEERAKERLRPFLERLNAVAVVKGISREEDGRSGFKLLVEIRSAFPRGATLADAWRVGDEAKALLELVEGDEIPRSIALDLLRAGRWNLFMGRPESDWLEAKGAPYELTPSLGANWRFELAKDVAAFANSSPGGLIVLGMTTKDGGDGDVIRGLKEFELGGAKATTYQRHIAQLVHPRVEGFEVVRVPGRAPGRGIAVLVIPPQDPSKRPFLVRGVINRGAVLGNFVMWPVRLGDGTALMDADGLHARLRLGDQAINGPADGGGS